MGPVRTAPDDSDGPAVDIADIVFAIAAAKNVDVSDLSTPLHDAIDTDALERLLRSADRDTRISFTYEELRVEVTGGGDLSVTELSDEE